MKRFNPVMMPAAYTFELELPGGLQTAQQVPIGDIAFLRDKTIIGVSTVDASTTLTSPSGNNVLSTVSDLYITLVDRKDSFEFLDNIPSADIASVKYYRPPYMFKGRNINFELSFINCATNSNAGQSVLLTFYFIP